MQIPDEFMWPDYGGGSIANVPATIASLLGLLLMGCLLYDRTCGDPFPQG